MLLDYMATISRGEAKEGGVKAASWVRPWSCQLRASSSGLIGNQASVSVLSRAPEKPMNGAHVCMKTPRTLGALLMGPVNDYWPSDLGGTINSLHRETNIKYSFAQLHYHSRRQCLFSLGLVSFFQIFFIFSPFFFLLLFFFFAFEICTSTAYELLIEINERANLNLDLSFIVLHRLHISIGIYSQRIFSPLLFRRYRFLPKECMVGFV